MSLAVAVHSFLVLLCCHWVSPGAQCLHPYTTKPAERKETRPTVSAQLHRRTDTEDKNSNFFYSYVTSPQCEKNRLQQDGLITGGYICASGELFQTKQSLSGVQYSAAGDVSSFIIPHRQVQTSSQPQAHSSLTKLCRVSKKTNSLF